MRDRVVVERTHVPHAAACAWVRDEPRALHHRRGATRIAGMRVVAERFQRDSVRFEGDGGGGEGAHRVAASHFVRARERDRAQVRVFPELLE